MRVRCRRRCVSKLTSQILRRVSTLSYAMTCFSLNYSMSSDLKHGIALTQLVLVGLVSAPLTLSLPLTCWRMGGRLPPQALAMPRERSR
jgi:hypothetical protein